MPSSVYLKKQGFRRKVLPRPSMDLCAITCVNGMFLPSATESETGPCLNIEVSKNSAAWAVPTKELQTWDPFYVLSGAAWWALESTVLSCPFGGVSFSLHSSRQKAGQCLRMNPRTNGLHETDLQSCFYLICPRTRGLFFVLFMFESNGTSKNCKKVGKKTENITVKQFFSSALVLQFFPQ